MLFKKDKKKSFNLQKAPQKSSFDFWLLATSVILTVLGILAIFNASVVIAYQDFGDKYWFAKNQFFWGLIGLSGLTIVSFIDYHFWKKVAAPLLFISLILMLAVLIPALNYEAYGAHRWLNLGFVKLQPSELLKISSIFYLAALFEKKIRSAPFFLLLGGVIVLTAVLQKDLGTTIIFVLTTTVIYFAAGAPVWHFLILSPVAGIIGIALIKFFPHRLSRLTAFFNPASDPQGASYHINQVLIALGSGGLFGLGLGNSRQKYEYLPETPTDSIFAIIGEELGFVGACLLILIFLFLIWRGFKIIQNAPDKFGQFLGIGIISWLSLQILLNLASMVALVPLTGIPLPFISYGGSGLVVVLIGIGVLLNISKAKNI